MIGTSEEVLLVFFSWFFRIYENLWYTAIKDIFFFVCLSFLLTITGSNEAIIVELKELFLLNGPFITFSGGVFLLNFAQLRKMVPGLAFNSVIVATSAWWGNWNRHAVAPSDYCFTQVPFLAPAVTVGETEGAMDSASVFFCLFFCL